MQPGILAPLPNECSAAFLVGNTKRLWPIFLDWVDREKDAPGIDADGDDFLNNNPLDTYTRETIGRVVDANSWRLSESSLEGTLSKNCNNEHTKYNNTEESIPYDIYWAADTRDGRLLSMQRLSSVSGLCYLDEASNMACHPTYGPWLSFRAAILFYPRQCNGKVNAASPPPCPRPVPKLLSKDEEEAAGKFVQKAFDKSTPRDDIHKHLIASRDCVKLGREEYRFAESQLHYHYTTDVKYLRRN